MKSRTWMWTAVVFLFAALVVPVGLAAQNNPSPDHRHKKYRLVDMGTLGGPLGYINTQGNGGPYINAPGAVVGVGLTTVPLSATSNPYECYPGPTVNHAMQWMNGQTIELPTLPPSDQNCSGTNQMGVNNRGEISYTSEISAIDPMLGVKQIRAIRWKDGNATEIGTFGGTASSAGEINNRGQIVGFALNTIPDPYSIYGSFEGSANSTQTRGFIWQNGAMQELGTLGGPDSWGTWINNGGDVAGLSYTSNIPNPSTGIPTMDPFLWRNGRMIDLGTLGGTFGLPIGLNNNDQVSGVSNIAGDDASHPFFWDRGHMIDLGTFGGSNGAANYLNDSGEVVGVADFPADGVHHAFLWKRGVMTDLGTLGGNSIGFTINSQGQIVGTSRVTDRVHAFLWEKGGPMVDLNDLVSPKSDVILQFPNAIADNGEIAVNGLPVGCGNADVCGHPYVLIPDGDADDDVEARIAASQSKAVIAQDAHVMTQTSTPPLSSLERSREMMRRLVHGLAAAPRD